MSPQNGIVAVHYYYLLKDDEEDLGRLWSSLTSQVRGKFELPAAMGLPGTDDSPSGFCRIVNRFHDQGLDLCLLMLSDLSVLQIIYEAASGENLRDMWEDAFMHLELDRDKVQAQTLTIFGETTLLVCPDEAGPEAVATALEITRTRRTFHSDIKPDITGGGRPALVKLREHDAPGRDFYLLMGRDPEKVASMHFPQIDSALKKLTRSAAYFEEQRNTIVRERAQVDRDVSALLHMQVVQASDEAAESLTLEHQIENLSRMFGMLATDSLLIRQAGETLARDVVHLQNQLDDLIDKSGRDEIGGHYLTFFRAQLGATRDEAKNLDFSRRNAQAAIEVVRTQVELLRAGEGAALQEQTKQLLTRSVVLQKERLALQAAAVFVEFVLVFYYVLKSWESIVGIVTFEHVSPVIRLLVVAGFAGGAAVGTHFLAQAMQTQSWKNRGLWISSAVLLTALAAMTFLSVTS